MAFSVPELETLIDALVNAAPAFKANNKGRDFSAFFVTLAHDFPADADQIIARLSSLEQTELSALRTSNPGRPSGGSRDATPRIRPVVVTEVEDCTDCPKPMTGTHRSDYSHLVSPAGVIQHVSEDPAFLLEHARGLGINVGTSSRADTLSVKIAHHYRGLMEQAK